MRPIRFAAAIGDLIETNISRGWYTITVQGGPTDAKDLRLRLDIGRGTSEHHSVGVWQTGSTKSAVVRLFKHVRMVQITYAGTETGPQPIEICFTPLSAFTLLGRRIAEAFALARHYLKNGRPGPNHPDRVFRRYLRWRDMFSFPQCTTIHSIYDEWILRNEALTSRERSGVTPFILLSLDDPERAGIINSQFCAICASHSPADAELSSTELNSLLDQHPSAWVLLVEPGYRLHPQAVAELRARIDGSPTLEMLYGDHDWIDVTGRRFNPHFQLGFSLDRVQVEDYLGPAIAIAGRVLRPALPGLAEKWTSARGNIVRHVAEKIGEAGVGHVPRVLAHALPEAWDCDTGDRRLDQEGRRDGARHTTLPDMSWPLVSLIIPTKDKVDLLSQAVDSILKISSWPSFEILIIDHESREQKTLDWLIEISQHDNIRVQFYSGPFNFSDMNNRAARAAKGSVLGFLNNDVEVMSSDWIEHLAGAALRDDIGCAGAMLLYPHGAVQHDGISLGIGGVAAHAQSGIFPSDTNPNLALVCQRNVSAVTGACLFVRATIFEQLGGFDSEHLPVAFNDIDLCLRAMDLGLRNIWLPEARLVHHESATRRPDSMTASDSRFRREHDYMRKRWGHILDNDRYYSENFDLRRPGLAIRL